MSEAPNNKRRMRQPLPSQRARTTWLLIYIVALAGVNFGVTGTFLPPATAEGLWFYTAAVSLLLGDLVVNPYYVGPRDSLAFSVPAGIAVWLLQPSSGPTGAWPIAALSLCLVIAAASTAALLLSRSSSPRWAAVNSWLMQFSQTVGHPKVVMTALFLLAIAEYHMDAPGEVLLVGGTWAVLVGVQPERPLYWSWQRLRTRKATSNDFGTVVGYQTPGVMLIRQEVDIEVGFGALFLCRDSHGPVRLAMGLDYVGRDESLLLRCMEVTIPSGALGMAKVSAQVLGPDRVGWLDPKRHQFVAEVHAEAERLKRNFLGLVDENTDVEELRFDIIRDQSIEEGHLVEVGIRGRPVLYQVVNGLTREEVAHRRHKYGSARVDAVKIGVWNQMQGRFERQKWLPALNAPVFTASNPAEEPDIQIVGRFPGSAYPIKLRSVSDLVTHNTAILGILGIGKSMLAMELVERMLANGIKVVALDLTNQYATELEAWHDAEADAESIKVIEEAGMQDRERFADNPEEGGSFPRLKHELARDLRRFMQSTESRLKIYNPARFAATRQENEPRTFRDDAGAWHRSAPLWAVTPVQVTQVVAETILYLVQDSMSDTARVCLVLEEAHSLVPEFSNVANDVDRNATNGTARAILQGRKYGFGCLLVTQRTANVTKTILNQCNSVFAMRTFDDTGKAFLANYLGSRYADMLPTLDEREAVFFGKGSSCENPVRVRLNDRDEFLTRFRAVFPPPTPIAAAARISHEPITEETTDGDAAEE